MDDTEYMGYDGQAIRTITVSNYIYSIISLHSCALKTPVSSLYRTHTVMNAHTAFLLSDLAVRLPAVSAIERPLSCRVAVRRTEGVAQAKPSSSLSNTVMIEKYIQIWLLKI